MDERTYEQRVADTQSYFYASEPDEALIQHQADLLYQDADDRVPEHDACPHCGEQRVDWLLIDEDHVDCMSCSKGYWLYGADGPEVA